MRTETRPRYRPEDFIIPGAEDLMPLETPLLRVSRPVAACSRCRAAKIKCDGKLPACTACERANKANECASTNDQFARGKERSYVATLEARIERLEQKINEARERRKSSLAVMEPAVWSPRRVSSDAGGGRPRERRAARRKELSDIDELVSDFGFLAVNATARDFYGFTSAMSYARLVLAASETEPLPVGMSKELPPRHTAMGLVQHYINHVQIVLPILDEASFYPSVDNVYNPDQRKATPFDHWIVRLVLAIASAAQSQQRGDTHYADAVGHICAAIGYAEHVLHPGSIGSIQAMLLLVLYAMLDPNHFDSWTLVGAASRAAVDLGMHQDPAKAANTPRAKLELRRRVFHCIYALDRSTSIVQTRAFSFSDDSAHVGLPFQSKTLSPPTSPRSGNVWQQSYESALDLIKLRQIQSSWYSQLFQSGRTALADPYSCIWEAYNNMASWFNKLSATTQPIVRDFFELELLYSYVYILSPNPRCPEPSEHAQRLIFEHCISYSGKMLHITTQSSGTQRIPLSFHDGLRVYMTGRHFVDVLANNFEVLLRPAVHTSSSFSSQPMDTEVDPLASHAAAQPPMLPASQSYDVSNSSELNNPVNRAISALNDFTSILSYFGVRFGYVKGISWRDSFQRESQPLLSQLQQRAQQQKQMDQVLGAWPGVSGPSRTSVSSALSPGSSSAYYPSPPNSHYSLEFPRSEAERPMGAPWPQAGGVGDIGYQMAIPTVSGEGNMAQMMAPGSVHDLGIGSLAAWQTLPGGSLNPRFT